jgi:ABC-type glycerol-3-phosphate transport system permease component
MAVRELVQEQRPVRDLTPTLAQAARERLLWRRLGLHSLAIAITAVMAFPMFWMVSTALKPATEVFTKAPHLFPSSPTLDNFRTAFDLKPVGAWLRNSLLTATGITAFRLAFAVPAAYALAHLRLPLPGVWMGFVTGTMLLPGVVTLIPNYLLVADLGWLNTAVGVIVPQAASSAFFIFLLRQHIKQIPRDLFDAAELDGAGSWRTLFDLVIPLIRPGILAVTALSFLWGWNAYLWPLLILPGFDSQTIAIGLGTFASDPEGPQLWGPLMATALLSSIPPLLVFMIAQNHLADALTTGLKE